MAAATIVATLFLAQAPAQAVDVGYEDLSENRNAAAIDRIEGNETLDASDPARLINLGIAYAREGRTDTARRMFVAAAYADRVDLETATGVWTDSRELARRALAALERGEFAGQSRIAMR